MKKLGLIAGLLTVLPLFLSSCATPQGTGEGSTTSTISMIIFIVVIFALFYLVMIRPQRRQQKEHQKLVQELRKGDEVITAGGIYGIVESLSDDSIVIKVESGATLRVARNSVVGRRAR